MKGLVLVLILSLYGCGNLQSIKETGQITPETQRVKEYSLELYCTQLTNTRRLLLRFIRAVDPQWTSVCELRNIDTEEETN